MAKSTDFKEIAANIYKNRSEHEQNIRNLCINTDICPIDEFFKIYDKKVRDINSEITPSKGQPTIADFKEVFSTFEEYPTNLKKLKRVVVPREFNRPLVNRAFSATEINSGFQNITLSPQKVIWEEGPPVFEIYNRFRQFKLSLNNLLQQLQQKDLEADYMRSLKKLNTFAKDIEKLWSGVGCQNLKKAFTDEEADRLRRLVANMESAIYIDANRDLFRNHFNQTTHNREGLLEILTYWLNAVAGYQEV